MGTGTEKHKATFLPPSYFRLLGYAIALGFVFQINVPDYE